MNFTFKSAPCGNGILLEEYVGTKKTASRWLSTEEYESLRQALNNSISIIETNAENATPKFKVEDWIVGIDDEGDVTTEKIVSFSHDKVLLVDTDGCHTEYPKTELSNFHLWSIEDAKDGDVLVTTKIKSCPFIYRKTCYDDGYAYYYVGIDGGGDLSIACPRKVPELYLGLIEDAIPATKEQRDLLFAKMQEAGYQWDAEKKELLKIIETNFKVGDWITDGISKCQIHFIDNTQYWYSENCILGSIESVNKRYHLWSIADAKDGDVLVCYREVKGNPIEQAGVFFGKYAGRSNGFLAHTGIDWDGNIIINGYMSSTNILPATKEQRDLLFKKIKEAGYEWDVDKKELKLLITNGGSFDTENCEQKLADKVEPKFKVGDVIAPTAAELVTVNWTLESGLQPVNVEVVGVDVDKQCYTIKQKGYPASILPFKFQDKYVIMWHRSKAHYDIANFHAGMPVLVRADNNCRWDYSVFSRITGNEDWPFAVCNGVSFTQCIPFNDETKHLLGTNDMPSREFINW